jgi:hypothetical protein
VDIKKEKNSVQKEIQYKIKKQRKLPKWGMTYRDPFKEQKELINRENRQ